MTRRTEAGTAATAVLPEPAQEAGRRRAWHEAWHDAGMTKGTAREAYFEALGLGLLDATGTGDIAAAVQTVAAGKPGGNSPEGRRWRRQA